MSFKFIHLRCHSAYSLLEGAIQVKKLPKLCGDMPALAITDTNNLFGALEFSDTLAEAGIQPIIGCQLNIDLSHIVKDLKTQCHYVAPVILLTKNENGYKNLLKIVSNAYLKSQSHYAYSSFEELELYHQDLIILTGGYDGILGKLYHQKCFEDIEHTILRLKNTFDDRLYIELQRLNLPDEVDLEKLFVNLAYKHDIPLVATNNVLFPYKDFYEAHDALISIAQGVTVADENRHRVSQEQYFKSADEMVELFKDIPEAIENTLEIAKRCAFKVNKIAPILPRYESSKGLNEEEELKHQAREGLTERLKVTPIQHDKKIYEDRLEFELDVICKMQFPGYFLIVADFIKWAKDHNIPVGPGRGSGAGSVVAWSLTITDLDPLRFGLLFERFLNPERVSMPDFDIDFCQDRRDEVISYVQQKYGHDKVAQIITFGKLQARAVMRDVGRVLQMPYGQVDKLCKMIPNNPANPLTIEQALETEEHLKRAKQEDEAVATMLDMAMQLEGLYRHASTHAAGVVIGDRPLNELVPLYRDPKSDIAVTQFNMKFVESAGLVKFDFLGLKTLTVLKKTVDLIKKYKNIDVDLSLIPLDDKKSYDMLGKGDSTGVFQLESSGMRDVLRKMKPDCIEDIIALVALYRPGPMDNIPKYIAVKKGDEEPDYLHPWLKDILQETYGVIIYQEQVMQIAQVLSGYSLGEADLLRRAMGKKIKEEMDQQKQRFIEGAVAKKVDKAQADFIFDLVAKFAGYGFNKSHAAAYAIVAYQTAYMKANYPVEFMAASMTLDMGNIDKLVTYKQELDRLKIKLEQPDVNSSFVEFVPNEKSIRFALSAIKNVGTAVMENMILEREKNGIFKDISDFCYRLDSSILNKRTMENLIKAGGLDSLHRNRKELLESLEYMTAAAMQATQERHNNQVSLFGSVEQQKDIIRIKSTSDFLPMQRLSEEFSALGFYLSAHPLDDYQTILKRARVISYQELVQKSEKGNYSATIAGTVIGKMERKSAKGNRYAFLQLSDPSGNFEVTLFSENLNFAKEKNFLETGKCLILGVESEVDLENGQIRLRIHSLKSIDELPQNSGMSIRIKTNSIQAIEGAHKILTPMLATKANQNQAGDISFLLETTDKIIECKPKDKRYFITPTLLGQLRNIHGIMSIEEI